MGMNIMSPGTSAIDSAAPISCRIWDAKYRLKIADGIPVDRTIEDTWRRVARSLSCAKADHETWTAPFCAALEDFRFLPRDAAWRARGRTAA